MPSDAGVPGVACAGLVILVANPIWIGLPGAVDYAKLLRMSMKIGLGESARFLSHQHGWVSRLLPPPRC